MAGLRIVALLIACAVAVLGSPVIFWHSDSIAPKDVVLLYGGDLIRARGINIWRLDDTGGLPSGDSLPAEAVQPGERSVKFVVPAILQPGVYKAEIDFGPEHSVQVILNRPELWFVQPRILLPGMHENQAAPGVEIQVVGKDFLLPGDLGQPKVSIRQGSGAWADLKLTRQERFTVSVMLPVSLALGKYDLRVSNGFGGVPGWSEPIAVDIRAPEVWPAKLFNVKKDFGAEGDDIADDTAAIEKALSAAKANGGGIVYLPWGIYRLSRYITIPPRTTLRGESKNASVLMWPVDEPKSLDEFTQAAIYGQAPYVVEDLSLIARKVNVLLQDTSFTQGVPADLKTNGPGHDVFIRRVNLQHWLLAGHPDRNPALWNTPAKGNSKSNGDGATTFAINGAENFEFSDVESQGGQIPHSQHQQRSRNRECLGQQHGGTAGWKWAAALTTLSLKAMSSAPLLPGAMETQP